MKEICFNNKKLAVVVVTVIVFATLCIPNNVFAITSEGFAKWDEITPINRVLYAFHDTGIRVNPNNVIGFACCATRTGSSVRGVIFCTTNSNYTGIQLQGPSQSKNFETNVMTTTYNGITLYLSFAGAGNNDDNYYTPAQFNTDGTPNNTQATDFLDYVVSQAGGGGNNPTPTTINYDLPAGNVAYIKLDNSFDGFGLTATMPVKSDAFSSTTGWNSTQRWGFSNTIATNGTQLANFGSQIQWSKNTTQTNIFGQTQEAYFYPEGPFAQSEYLVIVNPLYYAIQYTNGEGVIPSDAGVNQTVNNNSIHINCDDAISITVFQLTQSVTINNNIPSYTNEVTSGPYEGEVDPDTGDITWTDPDGGNNQPTTGGGNVPGTGETSFTSIINGIANRIVNVFQPAHDAIITLSNAVTNFAGWLYALYIWLPAPILTLLTSAISVAIIIGVIKVFI